MRRWFYAVVILFCGAVGALATISSALNSITIPGNNSQTAFTFPFVGVAASDISVIYTNASGVQTTLTQGPGTTQYQVTLNAAVAPSLWGVGGTVSYNPSGTPIASGTTLTIVRNLPYVQLTSLQNQASWGQLAQATEMALDQLAMQIQQISSGLSRTLAGPVNDPAGLTYTLPPAAQRANHIVCFDASGNVIACSTLPAGTVSTPMQPVVNAASLSAARTAMGLNSAATGVVNYGLQQGVSGANNIDVNQTPVQDSTNQSVNAAFHQTGRICTGPITYTLPRANTTWAGFGFWVFAVSGVCTITPNAADNFFDVASGTGIAVPPGSWVFIWTNAASSGTWWADYHGPTNPNLVAGVNSNALTFTLYAGPVQFRDPTLANGDPLWSLPANGISITIPSTATLGTVSSQPFRLWLFLAYNSGTPVLGVALCTVNASIFDCASWESRQNHGFLVGVGATTAGALYTSSATINDAVRIIGYAEYSSGLATAGTWASAPTKLQLCIAPFSCPLPGQTVQGPQSVTTFVNTGCGSASFVGTGVERQITPTSTINLIRFTVAGTAINGTDNGLTAVAVFRGATQVSNVATASVAGVSGVSPVFLQGMEQPATTSAVTYQASCEYLSGSSGGFPTSNGGNIILEEIMGALEPANDNMPRTARKVA
jgi:hypothetical protein